MLQNAHIVCKDANPADYHRQDAERGSPDFVMSSGALRNFWTCPARFKAGYESPDSSAKRWGSALDCLHLTPAQFPLRYVIRPETYPADVMECPVCKSVTDSAKCRKCGVDRVKTQVAKPWSSNACQCAEWLEAATRTGKTVLRKEESDQLTLAASRLLSDETIRVWHAASDAQVWVAGEWHDKETGLVVPVRCLIDYVPGIDSEFNRCLGDLKTTRNAAITPWRRWCHAAGYYIQAAFYVDAYVAATGEDRNTFCFVLSENFPPYQPAKRMLSQDFLTLGRETYQSIMGAYCQCLKAGVWPDYDTTDEAVQNWSIVAPEPWMQSEQLFAPRFTIPAEEPEPGEDAVPLDNIP